MPAMPVPFPANLRPMLSASKSRAQPAAFRMAQPRRGFPFAQSLGTVTPVVWDATFRFTQAEAQTFQDWFRDDLELGTLAFDLEIRTEFGLIEHECIFLPGGLLDTREVGEVWEYRAQILARAQLIPADAITAYAAEFTGPIPDQIVYTGVAFTLDLSSYWTAGVGPYVYSVVAGSLPPGIYLNAATGVVSGTTAYDGAAFVGVVFRRRDLFCAELDSNAVEFSVADPDPDFGSVIALLDATGAITKDSSSFNRTLTVSGAPAIASNKTLFGRPTYAFAGGGTESINLTDTFFPADAGDSAFCLEFWLNPGTLNDRVLLSFSRITVNLTAAGGITASVAGLSGSSFSVDSGAGAVGTAAWHHIAFLRDKTSHPTTDTLMLYIDGVFFDASVSFVRTNTIDAGAGFHALLGYVANSVHCNYANLRLSLVQRYTGAFTPPAAPFPNG